MCIHPGVIHGTIGGKGSPAAPLMTRMTVRLRFQSEESQQRIALFTDVAQTPALGTGVLAGNQSQIAGHLLAAAKPIRSSQYHASPIAVPEGLE
jgi:hypothetical protein